MSLCQNQSWATFQHHCCTLLWPEYVSSYLPVEALPAEIGSNMAGWPPWSTDATERPLQRSYTLIEAPENVVMRNRKCPLPWEEVSNKTASFFYFGEILLVPYFLWWAGTLALQTRRGFQLYRFFPPFERINIVVADCVCFHSLFYHTCGGKEGNVDGLRERTSLASVTLHWT